MENEPKDKTKSKHLPPLDDITQISVFNEAKKIEKSKRKGHVLVDGVERRMSKVSDYMMDIISTDQD